MASALTTLPNDILLEIFSPLSREDLYNLALVSSRLVAPSQRLLWKSIDLRLRFPSRSADQSIVFGSLDIFTRLVKTLADSPNLGSFVSKLSISLWLHGQEKRVGDFSHILGLLPRLHQLSLSPPSFDFEISMLPSSTLETLQLSFTDGRDLDEKGERQDPSEIIERVFWTPHLRTLLIDGLSFTTEAGHLFPLERYRTSPITDLEFRSGGQEKIGYLTDMLSCVRALKRFTFEMHTPWEVSHAVAQGMEPAVLSQSIGLHASTLDTLEIAGSDAAEFPETSIFGSLAGYPNLKRLAIPDELLLNVGDENATLSKYREYPHLCLECLKISRDASCCRHIP